MKLSVAIPVYNEKAFFLNKRHIESKNKSMVALFNLGDQCLEKKKWDIVRVSDIMDKSTLGLYYANGTTWEVCSNTGYIASTSGSYVGYIYATFTSSTTPTIDYLDGLALVGGEGAVEEIIPTLSEWGMLLFIVLLLLSGILFIIKPRMNLDTDRHRFIMIFFNSLA